MSKIMMYGTPTCGDCILAKQVFAENDIDYDSHMSALHIVPRVMIDYGTAKYGVYMFSDGYIDQFGGPKSKKFMKKRFKDLLVQINNKIINKNTDFNLIIKDAIT